MARVAPEIDRGGLQPEANPHISATDLVSRHPNDPQTSWAIGTFWAIAEYRLLSEHGAEVRPRDQSLAARRAESFYSGMNFGATPLLQ